jgi:hypothetical protein
MAARKAASDKPVTRSARTSVPQSGGTAKPRKSVAGSKPVRRTAPQSGRASQAVLPDLQPTKRQPVAYPSDRYPRINPTVVAAAFGRASKGDLWTLVSWDPKKQQWEVPSATTVGRSYRVWRRRGRSGPLPFYVALECNCAAEQKDSYLVCWHKCAVKLWLDAWFNERALGGSTFEEITKVGLDDEEERPAYED